MALSRSLFGGDSGDNAESYIEEILRQRRAWPEHERKKRVADSVIRRIVGVREKIRGSSTAAPKRSLLPDRRSPASPSVFQQHVASLALARRIKSSRRRSSSYSAAPIVKGSLGAETVRQFPFVDAAVLR